MSRIISQTVAPHRGRFWERQFAPDSTPKQDAFDVIFAIVLPILCFVIDPVVFRGGLFGLALLEDYQLVAYVVASVEMGLFLTWRTFRGRVSKFAGAFAAVFSLGAAFSGLIGLAILPYSLMGLMVVIGLLGFIPFFTAFVFLRNGIRALRIQLNHSTLGIGFLAAMLGGVLVLGVPVFATVRIESVIANSVTTMLVGNPFEAKEAADRLRRFPFVPDKYRDQIVKAYWRELNPFKRAVLRQAYEDITGLELNDTGAFFD